MPEALSGENNFFQLEEPLIYSTENFIFLFTSEIVAYTTSYRPWELVACFEAGSSRFDALKIEKQVKKLKSKVMLRRIIDGMLPEFLKSLNQII